MNLENKQFSPINDEKSKVIIELTEVISGKEYSFASEIYSFGMLMWEISSGQPPFAGFDHDYDLAMKIINGMRPRISYTLWHEINKINNLCLNENKQQINNSTQLNTSISINSSSINSLTSKFSKVHIFKGLPEPRNATEGKLFKFCLLYLTIKFAIIYYKINLLYF